MPMPGGGKREGATAAQCEKFNFAEVLSSTLGAQRQTADRRTDVTLAVPVILGVISYPFPVTGGHHTLEEIEGIVFQACRKHICYVFLNILVPASDLKIVCSTCWLPITFDCLERGYLFTGSRDEV
ncbi:unnamed protein product [Ceratitis capitata]|uniref:(Mediterranean fruit fly) hypothetical protein n=1 Tax=Ceratitis capitata TaxID=7213 RepID=A0A811VA22_CERCA|nr:unnamed protein product [Ceratitis capitata]